MVLFWSICLYGLSQLKCVQNERTCELWKADIHLLVWFLMSGFNTMFSRGQRQWDVCFYSPHFYHLLSYMTSAPTSLSLSLSHMLSRSHALARSLSLARSRSLSALFPSRWLWSTRSAQRCSFSTTILCEKQHMGCSVNEDNPCKNMTQHRAQTSISTFKSGRTGQKYGNTSKPCFSPVNTILQIWR